MFSMWSTLIIEIIKRNQTMNKRAAVTAKDNLKLITKECLSNRKNCFHGYFRVVSVCNKNKESVFYKRNQYCRSLKGGCDVFFAFPQKKVRRKSGRMKVVVVLIAFLSASVSAFKNGGIEELTYETFHNLVASNLAVVEFFAPW